MLLQLRKRRQMCTFNQKILILLLYRQRSEELVVFWSLKTFSSVYYGVLKTLIH